MSTTETRFDCITCGYVFDLSSGLGHEDAPDEGSISICIRCATLAVFTQADDGSLGSRPLTPDEWDEIVSDPSIARARAGVIRMRGGML